VRFTSFQARLLTWFLGLFILVEGAGLYLVGAAQERNAREQIDAALEVGAGVFHRLIDARTERLAEAARLLSADFAFKQACASGDRATIQSVLQNQQSRIGADLMLLADLDYAVVADTLNALAHGATLPFAAAIEDAVERGGLDHDNRVSRRLAVSWGRAALAPLPIPDRCRLSVRRSARERDPPRPSPMSLLRRDDDAVWQPFATTLLGTRPALALAAGAGWSDRARHAAARVRALVTALGRARSRAAHLRPRRRRWRRFDGCGRCPRSVRRRCC
jgi:hypothetical protein